MRCEVRRGHFGSERKDVATGFRLSAHGLTLPSPLECDPGSPGGRRRAGSGRARARGGSPWYPLCPQGRAAGDLNALTARGRSSSSGATGVSRRRVEGFTPGAEGGTRRRAPTSRSGSRIACGRPAPPSPWQRKHGGRGRRGSRGPGVRHRGSLTPQPALCRAGPRMPTGKAARGRAPRKRQPAPSPYSFGASCPGSGVLDVGDGRCPAGRRGRTPTALGTCEYAHPAVGWVCKPWV